MKLQVPDLCPSLHSYTKSDVPSVPVTSRTHVYKFNDTAYLLTIKRAGREYAWAAMEAGNPGIRIFLEDAFRMASHHAFEVWQWMVMKGYYTLQPASQEAMNTVGGLYRPVSKPMAITH